MKESRAFHEYVLRQGRIVRGLKLDDISLESVLTAEGDKIPVPILSAAMECVTGSEMAIMLARHGAMGVLPAGRNISIEAQLEALRKVKRDKAGFVENVITVRPDDPIRLLTEIEAQHGYSSFPVVDRSKKLVGIITEKRYHPENDLELPVRERMIPLDSLVVGRQGISLSEANERMIKAGIGLLPIIDEEGVLKSVVFYKDLKKHVRYKNAFVDSKQRLKVAAAISTHEHDIERAEALVREGVDYIFIDASHGYSDYQRDTIARVKALGVPVWGGNVTDAEGFNYLVEAGADGVKLGMGVGAGCITTEVKGYGSGQDLAALEIVGARNRYYKKTGRYIPLCWDGGIETTHTMIIAYAFGLDLIMMGKYFAGFTESPGELTPKEVQVIVNPLTMETTRMIAYFKPYWGEASARGRNIGRYQSDRDSTHFTLEGKEGWVLHKGRFEDHFKHTLKAIKSAVLGQGVRSLEEFRRVAPKRLMRLSPEAQRIQLGTRLL